MAGTDTDRSPERAHVHDSFHYRVGGCRVVANPAVCVLNGVVEVSDAWFELESRNFDRVLVVEVAGAALTRTLI